MIPSQYLEAALLYALAYPPEWYEKPANRDELYAYLVDYYSIVFDRDLFDDFIRNRPNSDAFSFVQDPFAGDFVDVNSMVAEMQFKVHAVGDRLSVFGLVDRAGQKFVTAYLANPEFWRAYQSGGTEDGLYLDSSSSAPASDRIVNFNDNQISDLDSQTTQIIEAVSAQNQIDDEPGLREVILGQLKAGRELIRAGSFRIFVLEATLIQSLTFLVKRYEKEAIGALAAALLGALLKHIGIDG
ncbi:hypothetical protein Sphch_0542 [Sphingobium chlorophenolicum L-1]|uniref:Uncharacterized protein n=1 Tax=Sphingobium chlorophenolicum L-1 TaxID=690566 RepID=F6EXJ0_SPHCR|nr:hypothetical protein [Sphingobium chlorophenolicum]AEG48237.1 hypothetical protein Sphch_0542 [Sphingobium chlorophenolicum L-1]